jgi:hypothetical protein
MHVMRAAVARGDTRRQVQVVDEREFGWAGVPIERGVWISGAVRRSRDADAPPGAVGLGLRWRVAPPGEEIGVDRHPLRVVKPQ